MRRPIRWLVLAVATGWVALGASTATPSPEPETAPFEIRHGAPSTPPQSAAGGSFALVADETGTIGRGGDFVLTTGSPTSFGGAAGSCFCSQLFADGFEIGDASRWSGVSF